MLLALHDSFAATAAARTNKLKSYGKYKLLFFQFFLLKAPALNEKKYVLYIGNVQGPGGNNIRLRVAPTTGSIYNDSNIESGKSVLIIGTEREERTQEKFCYVCTEDNKQGCIKLAYLQIKPDPVGTLPIAASVAEPGVEPVLEGPTRSHHPIFNKYLKYKGKYMQLKNH